MARRMRRARARAGGVNTKGKRWIPIGVYAGGLSILDRGGVVHGELFWEDFH